MKHKSHTHDFKGLWHNLIKKNDNYRYIFHEYYFSTQYKKYKFFTSIFALLRDFYIGIGKKTIDLKKNIFFFFTLLGSSGLDNFKNNKDFQKSNLIKVDLKRNISKKVTKLIHPLNFLFVKNFIKIFRSINWQKEHGLLLLIYSLRLSLWCTIWLNFLSKLKKNKCKIYIHNDFDIYNSSLIYVLKKNFLQKKKITTICFQHGIPTDEFFPTKSDLYVVWSKHMRQLFHKANKKYGRNSTKFKIENYLNIKVKRSNENIFNNKKSYFISQGHTKIFGEKLNHNLINFFTKLTLLIPNFYCLLHPNETLKNNNYKKIPKNKIIESPHNFSYKKKSNIYVCFCSTAMLKCMQNQHIVIGINMIPEKSLLTFNYLKPNLSFQYLDQIISMIELIKNNNLLAKKIINKQNLYLKKILGPNIYF